MSKAEKPRCDKHVTGQSSDNPLSSDGWPLPLSDDSNSDSAGFLNIVISEFRVMRGNNVDDNGLASGISMQTSNKFSLTV